MNKINTYTTEHQSIHRHSRPIALTLAFLATLLLASCEFWNEPVREYFKEWTEECSIAKYELVGIESYTDKDGNLCIASDHDAPVNLFLINPYHYTISDDKITPLLGGTISGIAQDSSDTTLLHFTYDGSALESKDGGGEIGGKIKLTHPKNGTGKDFTFSLKCNSRPPEVTKQCVNVSNQKYWVCFWLPTAEFASGHIHSDTRKIHIEGINGTTFEKPVAAELASCTASNPGDLATLDGSVPFTAPTSGDYTVFYFNTGLQMHEGDSIQWTIYLEDEACLKSKTKTVSTRVNPVNMTLDGGTLLSTNDGNSLTLNATVDNQVANWRWESSDEEIATVTADPIDQTQASVTANKGGEVSITAIAELPDGRTVQRQKTIRVVGVDFTDGSPVDFIKSQSGVQLSASAPSFATIEWESGNESIATVNSSGKVTAKEKGSTSITVKASYGGKTVSKQTTIYVHELTVTGGTELFVGGSATTLTASITPPSGRSTPSGITYSWTPGSGNAATINGSGNRCTASPGSSAGTKNVTCKAQLNGVWTNTGVTKAIQVYNLTIRVNQPTNADTTSDTIPTYTVKNLDDSFALTVTTGGQFPNGTSFSWTISDTDNRSVQKTGTNTSVKPSELYVKEAAIKWTVSCTATLPSGTVSPAQTKDFKVSFTLPSLIVVSVTETPTGIATADDPPKIYVGKYDSSSRIKFKVFPENMQSGVTYTWKVGDRTIAEGTDKQEINPTIGELRNSTTPPAYSETFRIDCTVSFRGCTSREGSKSFSFNKRTPIGSPTLNEGQTYPMVDDSSGYHIDNYKFSSGTNLEKIYINLSWNKPTGIPEGELVSYGIYINGHHVLTAPESLRSNGSVFPNTNDHAIDVSLFHDAGITMEWNTTYTISVQAWLQGDNHPEWDCSAMVDLLTVTFTKEDP